MNPRQLHHYLFSSLTDEELDNIPSFFQSIKNNEKFRIILRRLNATALEIKLYGKISPLPGVNEDALSSSEHLDIQFQKLNERYGYLSADNNTIALFKHIYYVHQILNQSDTIFDYYEQTYKMMVLFGTTDFTNIDEAAEKILGNFHAYCLKNWIAKDPMSVLKKPLREMKESINLAYWQRFIFAHNEEALAYFYIAKEVEENLGGLPTNLTEIRLLLAGAQLTLNQQTLMSMLLQLNKAETQSIFINTLTLANLKKLIGSCENFVDVFSHITHQDVQQQLLMVLPNEYVASLVLHAYDKSAMICVLHPENIGFFLKEKLNINKLLEDVHSLFELNQFIKNILPKYYDKDDFFCNVIPAQKLRSYIRDFSDLTQDILPYVKAKFTFLRDTIGKDKLVGLISSHCQLNEMLGLLLEKDRLPFLKLLFEPATIKKILMDKNYGAEIKTKLKSCKEALHEWLYTAEEISANATLKNIKKTIKKTPWSFNTFSAVLVNLGKQEFEVPKPVAEQVKVLHEHGNGSKSPQETLKEVKNIGNDTLNQNYRGLLTIFKNKVISKGETRSYFENFADEQTFNNAFRKK